MSVMAEELMSHQAFSSRQRRGGEAPVIGRGRRKAILLRLRCGSDLVAALLPWPSSFLALWGGGLFVVARWGDAGVRWGYLLDFPRSVGREVWG